MTVDLSVVVGDGALARLAAAMLLLASRNDGSLLLFVLLVGVCLPRHRSFVDVVCCRWSCLASSKLPTWTRRTDGLQLARRDRATNTGNTAYRSSASPQVVGPLDSPSSRCTMASMVSLERVSVPRSLESLPLSLLSSCFSSGRITAPGVPRSWIGGLGRRFVGVVSLVVSQPQLCLTSSSTRRQNPTPIVFLPPLGSLSAGHFSLTPGLELLLSRCLCLKLPALCRVVAQKYG